MKKIIAGAILVSASAMSFAGNEIAGCGLGTSVVFPDASAWYEHVLAATTNGTSGNQTFGITSGTSGCKVSDSPLAGAQKFMDGNMDQLAADTAQGQGETLSALAEVIGIQTQDSAAFNAAMQSNFDKMFSAESTSAQTFEAMKSAMAADADLQKYLG